MAKLAAYFDDSGTHDQSLAVVVGGYLSSAEKWEDFACAWADMLHDAQLTYWHQVEFAQRVKEYTGWTEEKRVEFMRRATGIINDIVIGGVVCGVDSTAFKELSPQFPAPPYTPYAFCAMVCFKHLEKWAAENFRSDPIDCVFESGTQGRGEISKMVLDLMSDEDGERLSFRIGSVRFEGKKQMLPVQAADILAYEFYLEALNGHVTGELRPTRKSLQGVGPKLFGGTFYARSTLEEYIARSQKAGG